MKRIALTDKRTLDKLIPKPGGPDVLVERDGHPVALIVPFTADDLAWYAQEHDPAFIKSIARARRHVRQGKTIRLEDLKAELGIA